MNRIRYTRHGKIRASERDISEEMIQKAISEPDLSYYDLSVGATVVFRKFGERNLLVAYSGTRNEAKVITTFITSDAQQIIKKKLESGVWVRIECE